jgi:hypothetical protein
LDGFGIFERLKLDVVSAMKAASGGLGGAEVLMALVQAFVKEAIAAEFERGRLALNAIGLDVVAERDRDPHGVLLWWWGGPPGGYIFLINRLIAMV